MKANPYSAAKWQKFDRLHALKQTVSTVYWIAYCGFALVLFVLNRYEVGIAKTGWLMLVIGVGGALASRVLMIMMFGDAYEVWRREFTRLFEAPGKPKLFGQFGFYTFMSIKKPSKRLEETWHIKHEIKDLQATKAVYMQELKASENTLAALELKQQLLVLVEKFPEGSKDAARIYKAIDKQNNLQALRTLVDEMDRKEPPQPAPVKEAIPRDKIAELRADYLEAAGDKPDVAAQKIYAESLVLSDRKAQRKKLVEAISLQRSANRQAEKLLEQSRSIRKGATA